MMKALVPAYSELTALPPALFLFRSLLTPAAQQDGLEKFGSWPLPRQIPSEERPGADAAAAAPAQARGIRRLVRLIPVICPTVLLIASARGRASIIGISVGGSLHAAL